MNAQDVLREVYDGDTRTLGIRSNVTLYAVVNTGAAGVQNSIVTVANTPLSTQIIGNVTISGPIPSGVNGIGFATVAISNPTLYAVVNTGEGGIGQSIVTVANNVNTVNIGNITLDVGSKVQLIGNVSISSNIAWDDPKTYIGLVTSTIGNATLRTSSGVWGNTAGDGSGDNKMLLVDGDGSLQVDIANTPSFTVKGNVTITDGKTFIGLVTTVNGAGDRFIGLVTVGNIPGVNVIGNVTLSNPNAFIGLATTVNGAGDRFIGLVTAFNSNQPALVASAAYIGCVSVQIGTGTRFIGLVTVGNVHGVNVIGNVTLSNANGFIGLVTSSSLTAGTTKSLINLPIAMSTGSVATIAIPTNANTVKVTNLVLNSDATVRIAIKSGVTYLTGSSAIGITLNPGGGWIQTGAPDSPSWIGLPSGALVIEKFDMTSTSAKIGGNVVYFQE